MLLDLEEFQIMASALQPQLRIQESDAKFHSLFEYFFGASDFARIRILELGPGQCDFSRLSAGAGAAVVVMDHDPAVLALARKRGYEVISGDFLTFDWTSLRGEFDGLFSRHSIAAQRFDEPAPLVALVNDICAVLKPGGWGWILPWNRFRGVEPGDAELMLAAQRQAFEQNGFAAFELVGQIAGSGGVWDHHELFLKRVDPGPEHSDRERLLHFVGPLDPVDSPGSGARSRRSGSAVRSRSRRTRSGRR